MTTPPFSRSPYRALRAVALLTFSLAVAITTATTVAAEPTETAGPAWREVGRLSGNVITECSALIASRRQPGVLWTLNDSGNSPELFAIDASGRLLARVRVEGAHNVDWEDLAIVSAIPPGAPPGSAAVSTLVVADMGDNAARRDKLTLYFVPEPELSAATLASLTVQPGDVPAAGESVAVVAERLTARPTRTVEFTFEDGPRDCEGVAVDPANGQILLIAKRVVPPVLYTMDLTPPATTAVAIASGADRLTVEAAVAQRRGPITLPGIPLASLLDRQAVEHAAWGQLVTGVDLWPDGQRAVLLTYTNVCVYSRRTVDEDWAAVLLRPPVAYPLPTGANALKQAEGVCVVPSSGDAQPPASLPVIVASELAGAASQPIIRLDVSSALSSALSPAVPVPAAVVPPAAP